MAGRSTATDADPPAGAGLDGAPVGLLLWGPRGAHPVRTTGNVALGAARAPTPTGAKRRGDHDRPCFQVAVLP
jgi:hypothetical protein